MVSCAPKSLSSASSVDIGSARTTSRPAPRALTWPVHIPSKRVCSPTPQPVPSENHIWTEVSSGSNPLDIVDSNDAAIRSPTTNALAHRFGAQGCGAHDQWGRPVIVNAIVVSNPLVAASAASAGELPWFCRGAAEFLLLTLPWAHGEPSGRSSLANQRLCFQVARRCRAPRRASAPQT